MKKTPKRTKPAPTPEMSGRDLRRLLVILRACETGDRLARRRRLARPAWEAATGYQLGWLIRAIAHCDLLPGRHRRAAKRIYERQWAYTFGDEFRRAIKFESVAKLAAAILANAKKRGVR